MRTLNSALIVILFVFLFFATNPTKADFIHTMNIMLIENSDKESGVFEKLLSKGSTWLKLHSIESSTNRNNFVFFSVYEFEDEKGKAKYLGLLSHFFRLSGEASTAAS